MVITEGHHPVKVCTGDKLYERFTGTSPMTRSLTPRTVTETTRVSKEDQDESPHDHFWIVDSEFLFCFFSIYPHPSQRRLSPFRDGPHILHDLRYHIYEGQVF